jgi:hypothetical protein
MVTLSASVLSAMVVDSCAKNCQEEGCLLSLSSCCSSLNTCQSPLPATPTDVPPYVTALADLPNDGGVLDQAAPTKYLQLYYQTVHRKPLVFGYVARTPSSIVEKEKDLNRAINRENYTTLWDLYRVRYIVTAEVIGYDDPYISVELIYQDGDVNIYRLACKCDSGE